jgi:hypothetical protein
MHVARPERMRASPPTTRDRRRRNAAAARRGCSREAGRAARRSEPPTGAGSLRHLDSPVLVEESSRSASIEPRRMLPGFAQPRAGSHPRKRSRSVKDCVPHPSLRPPRLPRGSQRACLRSESRLLPRGIRSSSPRRCGSGSCRWVERGGRSAAMNVAAPALARPLRSVKRQRVAAVPAAVYPIGAALQVRLRSLRWSLASFAAW